MTEDFTIDRMRQVAFKMIPAVMAKDAAAVAKVYDEIQRTFDADGPQTVAVLLAERIAKERQQHQTQLARVNEQSTRYAEGYLVEKRKAEEWREINHDQAAMIARLKTSLRERGGDPG